MRAARFLVVLCFACTSSSGDDAGADAAARMDAGMPDVSSVEDTGNDAGFTADSAPQQDVGPGMDSGTTPDAGPASDAGPGDDTGPAQCSVDNLCEGACTGRSCSATWFCVTDVPCTDDIATYCGCDGTTFTASSSCPSRPFVSMGPCPTRDGASCDTRGISCRRLPPECERGLVPEVDETGGCWTSRCVPIGECGCSSPEECPDPDNYTCRNDMNRCTPFL